MLLAPSDRQTVAALALETAESYKPEPFSWTCVMCSLPAVCSANTERVERGRKRNKGRRCPASAADRSIVRQLTMSHQLFCNNSGAISFVAGPVRACSHHFSRGITRSAATAPPARVSS